MRRKSLLARRTRKKGQVWITDYTMSLLLFILATVIAIKILINAFGTNTAFTELKADTAKISEMLLSEGVPANWDADSVLRPGILEGSRVSSEKAYAAMNMSYEDIRPKFQTRYDFIAVFKDKDDVIINFTDSTGTDTKCVIGSPDVGTAGCSQTDLSSIDYDNMVKLTRIIIYDASIVKMEVYAWAK
ncbi:hypothetical protein JXB28_00100 [Candidatus Woesearchaeota archaeon]|nr:hypothetical protein [Candidatus Woesearchaeota archaeon]